MKKITIIILLFTGFAFVSAIMKEDGRAGVTGSPGESTCNTSGCHTGNAINAPGGSIAITASTMPGWEYIPGQVYPINVTVARQGVTLFGFGFEALRSTGANAGTLTITNAIQTKILTAVVGGNVRTNVVHKTNGGASFNSHTFTFNWTAPVTGTGTITFYSAGNAANNNGGTSGDFIYNTSQIVTESTIGLADIANNFSMQVYPNPVIDKLDIRFTINDPAFVNIKLIDIKGKSIDEIISVPLAAGDQLIHYNNAATIPPGVYFLLMTIDNQQMVKRIAVL